MATDLRRVRAFSDLVSYLDEELGWPLRDYSFDELTFEYSPEELGLKTEEAVKIKGNRIFQLRPPSGSMPWGIFFIEFESKRLPVAVMRRILSRLVIKKRQSANSAERAAWRTGDLLFISVFGEHGGSDPEIAFAHFHEETGDLPTLRVVGWDGSDTPLKLDYVKRELKDKLSWPENEKDHDAWRVLWASAFRHRVRHVITKSDELAQELAALARGIRKAANSLMKAETEKGRLRKLHKAFQTALIHDLTEDAFADTYAQTITYGLLTAAISRTDVSAGRHGTVVFASNVADLVPVTNPFLKEMLETFLKAGGRSDGIDFDELGIHDVVELLRGDETDLPAIIRDFGNKNPNEDPVIHFYEHFLAAYDKPQKKQRGVFYTPQPVVSYIVRSVDELLKSEFGIEDGLASTVTWAEMAKQFPAIKIPEGTAPDSMFVQVLDPATGTGTFLVETIDLIHTHLAAKWDKGGQAAAPRLPNASYSRAPTSFGDYWNQYVPLALLPRLHGYELMMAPYAIAHMKIGLKLFETGYRFGSNERARVYLTNALEPPAGDEAQKVFEVLSPALAHEALAVSAVKQKQRFTAVIGNPPYANYSANLTQSARRIVDRYRTFRGTPIRERNQLQFERNIQDDFVKFISIAHEAIRSTGLGALGYITNATMLASTSLRGMRERLTEDFGSLFELNLHGGGNELIDGISDDENVFDIVQAVAVHVYLRSASETDCGVMHADLLGPREKKYAWLSSHTAVSAQWQAIPPDAENCSFTPQDQTTGVHFRRLNEVFVQFGAGIKTNRDSVAIAHNVDALRDAVGSFDGNLVKHKNFMRWVHPLLYRPFDMRQIFYHEDIVASRSLPTMQHILAGPNVGLVASSTWTTPDRFSVNVSRYMVEMKTGTHDRGTTFFPLYRYESILGAQAVQVHNLSRSFIEEWSSATNTRFLNVGIGDGRATSGPEDAFFYLYAVCHSPEYRRRFRAALAQKFPIVFLTRDASLRQKLISLGQELSILHLMEAPRLMRQMATYIGSPHQTVEKISWSNSTVWVDKQQSAGFKGVNEAIWNFHVGGYPVCEKWLKDRRGQTLSKDDIIHYQKIVVALSETIRIMVEIDKIIDQHGGWPDAFVTSGARDEAALAEGDQASDPPQDLAQGKSPFA